MMRHMVRGLSLAALAALLVAGCGGIGGGRRAPRPAPFGADPRWDDGQAEVSLYTGTTLVEGEPRPTEARIAVRAVAVSERTLAPGDSGAAGAAALEALQMIEQADFAVGASTDREQVAVTLRRADLEPLQASALHADGLGITFVRLGARDGRLTRTSYSYADGDAEAPVAAPGGELLWTDALPLALRAMAEERLPFERKLWLLPSQVGAHAPASGARPVEATVRLVGTSPLSVPDGAYAARHFAVTTPHGTDLYWFDAEAPHVLLKVETAAGRKLELVNTLRIAYWERTSPGDERLLLE